MTSPPDRVSFASDRNATQSWHRTGRLVVAICAVLAVLVVAFVALGVWRGHRQAIAVGELRVRNLSRVIAAHAEQGVKSIELNLLTIEHVMHNWPSGQSPTSAQVDWLLKGRLRLNPDVGTLLILDRDGVMIHAASKRATQLGASLTDQPYFQWHRDNPSQAARIGRPMRNRATEGLYIPISRRLTAADGAFDGIALAALEPQFLENFYTSVQTGPYGSIAVFLRDGTLLARGPRIEGLVGTSLAGNPLFRDYLNQAGSGSFRQVATTDGVARIFGYATVGDTGLVVTVGFGEEDILAGWRQQSLTDAAATLLFLAALAALAVALLRQLDRQRALTETLARSEARYRRLLDTAGEGVWIVDTDRRTVLVNPKVCTMLGYSEDELKGANPFDFVIEEDRGRNLEMVERRRREGAAMQYDLRYRRSDGSVLWTITSVASIFDENGAYAGALGMLTDITARAHVEADRQRQLRRLAALHAMDEAILEARSRETVAAIGLTHLRELVPYWAATVMAFDFVANRAQVLDIRRAPGSPLDPGPGPSLDDYGRHDIARLQRGRECVVGDIAILGERSAVVERLYNMGMRSYVRIPLLAEGVLVGAMNLGLDRPGAYSTEDVAMARHFADQMAIALRQAELRAQVESQAADLERRVVERTAQLESVNRELESFSYSVSHDLRAPVRHIRGYTGLLLEDADGIDKPFVESIRRIDRAARRMSDLIDDLLTLARTGSKPLHREPLDMGRLVREVIEEFEPQTAARGIEWRLDALPDAEGDASLLSAALQNLIGNAVKYTSRRTDAIIEISADTAASGEVVYHVRDNGAGFDMRDADKLFGVFSRLHSERDFEGTGVGLATVRRIFNRHGGRIWAEAAVGHGATFHFTLPPL